jgi:hypothetical protein
MNAFKHSQVDEEDADGERPFDTHERATLRDMMERDRHGKWLWSTLRTWAIWIAAVGGAVSLSWEAIGRVVRALVGKGD